MCCFCGHTVRYFLQLCKSCLCLRIICEECTKRDCQLFCDIRCKQAKYITYGQLPSTQIRAIIEDTRPTCSFSHTPTALSCILSDNIKKQVLDNQLAEENKGLQKEIFFLKLAQRPVKKKHKRDNKYPKHQSNLEKKTTGREELSAKIEKTLLTVDGLDAEHIEYKDQLLNKVLNAFPDKEQISYEDLALICRRDGENSLKVAAAFEKAHDKEK